MKKTISLNSVHIIFYELHLKLVSKLIMSLNKYGSRIYKLERLQTSFRSCLYRKYGHQLSAIRFEIWRGMDDIDIKLIIKLNDVMERQFLIYV